MRKQDCFLKLACFMFFNSINSLYLNINNQIHSLNASIQQVFPCLQKSRVRELL